MSIRQSGLKPILWPWFGRGMPIIGVFPLNLLSHRTTMPFVSKNGKKRRASDADYVPPSSVSKRMKTAHSSVPAPRLRPSSAKFVVSDFELEEKDDPLPPSSAPASPTFWDDDNEPIVDEPPIRVPAPLPVELELPPLAPCAEVSALPETPPASPSSGGPLTSPFLPSPLKPYGGRPRVAAPRRNARGIRARKQAAQWEDLKKAQEAAARVDVQMLQLPEEPRSRTHSALHAIV
ncbi:hypothetical protein B0H12DRAFT_617988 [Mycena haematopus]|nr:hypothetical protein B0H12DRAFT_617988 [Mycena haematopus]